jgi:hypothetical protein
MSAHVISEYVLRSARTALSTAARNAHGLKSAAYSALIASLLYEDLRKELGRTQADEAEKRDMLTKAIACCRPISESSPEEAVEVLRAVLKLLETGGALQTYVTPRDRRAELRVIEGNGSLPSKPVVSPSKPQLREIG